MAIARSKALTRLVLAGAILTGPFAIGITTAAAATSRGPTSSSGSGFLSGLHAVTTVASTIPANGDENPYAVIVAPVTAGVVRKGDVLVDNFNAKSNEQGTGTTIVDISPAGSVTTFADVPGNLKGCPGGVGLTTAMTMLQTGWVIVGSTPSIDGTTASAHQGCLIVLNSSGKVVSTITNASIDGPWDMATVDVGATATLFLTDTLFGIAAPGQPVIDRGEVVRISLRQSATTTPTVTGSTVIANGLPEQASSAAFVLGPTGVAYSGGTAFVADPLANAIVAIPNAMTRTSSAGAGVKVTAGGYLHHPIAMVTAPNGDLLVTNGLNGDIVEVTRAGVQLRQLAIDPDPAQSPAGSGDLFGLAVAASGKGVYFAKDDTNTLALLH